MRNSRIGMAGQVAQRSTLLAAVVAMLASCAMHEPAKSPESEDKNSSALQARIVPVAPRVEQRIVEGRLQFVFCVSDCQEPTPKVLQVKEFKTELAEVTAKGRAVAPPAAPTGDAVGASTPAIVAAPVATSGASAQAAANSEVITPVETLRLSLDRDLLSWWVVYFRWASAELGPHAKSVLDRSVGVAKRSKRIIVSATADPTGDQEKNRKLVRERVQAVKSYLVAKGVDAAKLELAVMPESANGLPSLALTLAGIGMSVPAVQGMTLPAEKMAKQRRTELLIQFSK